MTRPSSPNFPAIFTEMQKDLRPFDRDMATALDGWANNQRAILDRGISFDDNVDAVEVTFTSSGTPDAENTVAHSLGRVPSRFVVSSIDKAAIVYKGSTAFTKTNVYLKVNVATVAVKVLLF